MTCAALPATAPAAYNANNYVHSACQSADAYVAIAKLLVFPESAGSVSRYLLAPKSSPYLPSKEVESEHVGKEMIQACMAER